MHPETRNNDLQNPSKEPETANTTGSPLNTLSSAIFYIAILLFIIGFNFSDVMVGNWYQQFMPNLGSQQINDIIFIDSLKGFAISSRNVNPDTSSILRTTNGGDTWQIIQTLAPRRFSRIKFVNNTTGFISGGSGSGTPYLYKTIDGGNTWNTVPGATLGNALWGDMAVISEDTIWLTDANSLNGGVYRTTNGGANWEQQLNLGSSNPDKIYMVNRSNGFICQTGFYLRKTTNSGINWYIIPNDIGFRDMYFTDSLRGWKCGTQDSINVTTNGGESWFKQLLPPTGGFFNISVINNFGFVNKDTIYGAGPRAGTSLGFRGMLYKTVNGGQNWGYQLPDTNTINISRYNFVDFINKSNGWAYSGPTGIHTTNGGDTTIYLPVQQISTEVPKEYRLYQNYPNPFNPVTNIKYSVKRETSDVKLVVFDITGKEIIILVNQKQSAGTYEVDFSGSNYSSGLYFYSLIIDGKLTDTKKMILLK